MAETHPGDLAAVRRWFKTLEGHIRSVDYAAARPLFAADMVAFGTFSDFVTGRAAAEREQWRNVWGTIRNFRWRLGGVRALVSSDRLSAVGLAVWDSDGFRPDGSKFNRRGRATVAFHRAAVGDPWIAVHTHMSLSAARPAACTANSPGMAAEVAAQPPNRAPGGGERPPIRPESALKP
jgi:ketosteroid isomerase-like protein